MNLRNRTQQRICQSGRHLWVNREKAQKCCAGHVPVHVPFEFHDRPELWAEEPLERLHDYWVWSRIVIPDQETELLRQLWVRQPTAYQSSTGPVNPGLHATN